jgi:hypothetical protein
MQEAYKSSTRKNENERIQFSYLNIYQIAQRK